MDMMYNLSWNGHSAWVKARPDSGHQPSLQALVTVLLFMRELINAYAADVAGTEEGGASPVWALPRYTTAPPVTPEEIAAAAQAAHEGDEGDGWQQSPSGGLYC